MKEHWYNTIQGRLKTILSSAEYRAKNKNIKFELDFEWLNKKFQSQKGCCLLTHCQFDLLKHEKYSSNPFAPTLDRKNPKKGYTKTNTRLVCYAINCALNEFGDDVFYEIASKYIERQNGRININNSKQYTRSKKKLSEKLSGSRNPKARLTEIKVKEIRERFKNGESSQKELSERYNISYITINNIINRKTWKHI